MNKREIDELVRLIRSTGKSDKSPKVMVRVIRGWNHNGTVLLEGARVLLPEHYAKMVISRGYGCYVDDSEPYCYPASKAEHGFKRVSIENNEAEDEAQKEKAQSQLLEDLPYLNEGTIEALQKAGLYSLKDLRGRSLADLRAIPGIGYATAQKLLKSYNAYKGEYISKEDGMQVTEK